jgi:hypothetical protein
MGLAGLLVTRGRANSATGLVAPLLLIGLAMHVARGLGLPPKLARKAASKPAAPPRMARPALPAGLAAAAPLLLAMLVRGLALRDKRPAVLVGLRMMMGLAEASTGRRAARPGASSWRAIGDLGGTPAEGAACGEAGSWSGFGRSCCCLNSASRSRLSLPSCCCGCCCCCCSCCCSCHRCCCCCCCCCCCVGGGGGCDTATLSSPSCGDCASF